MCRNTSRANNGGWRGIINDPYRPCVSNPSTANSSGWRDTGNTTTAHSSRWRDTIMRQINHVWNTSTAKAVAEETHEPRQQRTTAPEEITKPTQPCVQTTSTALWQTTRRGNVSRALKCNAWKSETRGHTSSRCKTVLLGVVTKATSCWDPCIIAHAK